jgi:transposase
MKTQLTRDRVRLQNQMECLLEQMRIQLSMVVSDLLGGSGLRILRALAEGETDPKKLAALGDDRLKCSEEQRVDALTGRLQPRHRAMLALQRERLQLIDRQIAKLNGMIAQAMKPQQEAVIRLAEVPGLGVDSAQQVIAEVGVQASTFASAAELTSGVGTCPGKEESAEQNHSSRSAKGEHISAAGTEPGGSCWGEEKRQSLSSGVPASAVAAGLSVRHLGKRPSALPRGLEDLA